MGPAPWYSDNLREFQVGQRRFHWVGPDHDTLTEIGIERPLFVTNVYSRTFSPKTGYLAVFGNRAWRKGDGHARPFSLAIFDVADLKPITPPPSPNEKRNGGPPFFAMSHPVETIEIPDTLSEGTHRGFVSRLAEDVPELLFIEHGPLAPEVMYSTSPAA